MTRDRTWVIAIAATLWGASGILREPLARTVDASTIVFYEHLVIVLLLTPWVVPALRHWTQASPKVDRKSVV